MEELNQIVEFFKWAVPFILAYNIWIHNNIIRIDKELAVNSSRDNEITKKIDKLEQKIDELISLEMKRNGKGG